ncbi:MAG TPA: GNAT family N-acetyltransferase [Bacteroidia bacterium]|jgi:RimJ/RimL family protein N-acetyltransferase|nr:GNAT family N-acetyltransferase [Bacteroidia bacterium]
MDRAYKILPQNKFLFGNYCLVPIRDEDKYSIMQWRNEQIDILRQKQPLTKEQQENYFATVIADLFKQEKPQQLLFSFLKGDVLIGYGGLVHIDWESKNAEISFITDTKRNIDKGQFISDWGNYLKILKEIAKEQLHFTKIYTYAYDLRPHLYDALLQCGLVEEARLKNHILVNGKNYDVLIHSCFLNELAYRMANENDLIQYYEWANDDEVRNNSFSSDKISLENHKNWFLSKLKSSCCSMYLFLYGGEAAGQVRIDKSNNETVIGISVDKQHRGKSLGIQMLCKSTNDYLSKYKNETIIAYVKETNIASLTIFTKAGFTNEGFVKKQGYNSYKLYKKYIL